MRRAADRHADVPLGGAMKHALGADLVQGDDQEQAPQFFASGCVVHTATDPSKKAPEHRLDDVFVIDATGQVSELSCLHQSQEAIGVAMVEKIGGILIALTEPPHERMIRRLGLGMVSGFLIRYPRERPPTSSQSSIHKESNRHSTSAKLMAESGSDSMGIRCTTEPV